MSSVIKIKRNTANANAPAQDALKIGELAVNIHDTSTPILYVGVAGSTADTTVASAVTASDASTSTKGVASFDSSDFSVSSGNVTLGDSADGAVLGVTGTANETSVSRSNGTVTVGIANNPIIPGNLGVTGTLHATGNATFGGTADVTGALAVTGNATLRGTADVTSNLTVGGTADVTGALAVTGTSTLRGAVTTSSDLTVGGNLTVSGTTTTVNSSTVTIDDSHLKLADGNTADTVDIGIYAQYHDGTSTKYSGFFRDQSDTEKAFVFYKDLATEPEAQAGLAGPTGNISTVTLAQIDAVIDGGTYS